MNTAIQKFIEELKNQPNIFGVVLFGSQARGNNRPDSDVDLLVIQEEGFRRAVEYRDGQNFEIIYTTPELTLKFWQDKKDDCYNLWSVAKVLYDKDGTIEKLKAQAEAMIKDGKAKMDESQRGQLQFSAMDEIAAVESLAGKDEVAANLLLNHVVFTLTTQFFDLRQLWTPAPKQRVEKIKELKPQMHTELVKFHQAETTIQDNIATARRMVSLTFE